MPEMSAREVVSAFHRDAPYLFLGAAFAAVGMVSAAFAVTRRKRDSLLILQLCSLVHQRTVELVTEHEPRSQQCEFA